VIEQSTRTPLLDKVDELAARFSEPDWLLERRRAALAIYEQMPSPKLELTDLTKHPWEIGHFLIEASNELLEPSGPGKTLTAFATTEQHPAIYVQDGVVRKVYLPEELAEQGVCFTDLHTASVVYPELVQKYLGTVVTGDESKWTALNLALWHGGVFLYVPKNVVVEQVFQFVYVETAHGGGAIPRVLIVGGENSRFSYAEFYYEENSLAPGTVHAPVTEVVVAENAEVKLTSLHRIVEGPTNYLTCRASADRNARVDWTYGSIGNGFTVSLVECCLEGEGAYATIGAIDFGYGRQRMDLTVSVVHAGQYSESNTKLYSVLRDRANAVYWSSTHILDGAVSAGSEQVERVLLLDRTVHAEAIPMLLIDEDDVQRCGHGATVGKIDPLQIYYMMSRGIPRVQAEKMIVWGHLQQTMGAIPLPEFRELMTTLIDELLSASATASDLTPAPTLASAVALDSASESALDADSISALAPASDSTLA
jgi:Fe-S cluster assembly protein SufD